MKLKRKIERRFSISAQRLAVRPHIPWYIRWAIAVPLVILLVSVIWWAYDSGLELAGFHRGQAVRELEELREKLGSLQEENAKLSSKAASYERQAQMEHAANDEISNQIRELSDENIKLKESLSFYQTLPLSQGENEGDLSVKELKIEKDSLPGEYIFRMVLVQSVKQRGKAFLGSMQLIVNAVRDGKKVVIQLPAEQSPQEQAAYQLNFKYYQVIDRAFKVPADLVIDNVQVRVYERGIREPKVAQNIRMS